MEEFPKKLKDIQKRKLLDKVAEKEAFLVNRWIIGSRSNPYFQENINNGLKNFVKKGDEEYYALIEWTLPSEKYEYSLVSYQELCREDDYKLIRSGIIPITNIRGERYWLLGSFHDYKNTGDPILADFGGKCDDRDKTASCPALACAFRELREESKDLLASVISVALKNIDVNVVIYKGINREKKQKIFFIFVYVNYNELRDFPYLFDRKIGKEKLGPIDFYKQSRIKRFYYRTAKNLTDFIEYLNAVSR